jgi:hypothetical protein
MTIGSPADLVPIVVVGTAMLGGILWLVKAQAAILREFRPNGGSSLKDQMNRLERDFRYHRDRLDKHIDHHPGGK